ncbi:MAG: YbgC/FadM family acyl-CoA thioesterase [Oleiphilaceae bacterium]|nr:YbgC/FadM family acyl-CoA thioesterase [Oleiphilaceae bacterium]
MIDHAQASLRLPIRVYIEDTDAGGIVFYANYLKYFERARTEFVRARGIALRAGMADNVNYVVHSLDAKYFKPAKLDDEIVAIATLKQVGRTYFDFEQRIESKDESVLVSGNVRIACVHLDSGKPRRLPTEVQAALGGNQQ